jgi:outer membrane protein insertion porin family
MPAEGKAMLVPAGVGRAARWLGATALALLLNSVAPPAGAADTDITVQGNRRVDADAIRAPFHGAPASSLDPAAINAALKELYRTGQFDDVRIARNGTRLVVTVAEAPVIQRLSFEGNKQLKDKDLAKALGLKARGAMTKAAVQNDVALLIDMYRKIGRYEVQVTPKTIPHGEGRVDLVFEIKEGDKTGVKRIDFTGNRGFAASRLKGVVKTTESGWFAFLKTSDVYDPDRLDADAELLRHFYVKNGHADARVAAAGVYDPAQKGFTVTFAIDEGDSYRFGAIDVTARVAAVTAEPLRAALRIKPGDVFDGEAVDKGTEDIATAAGKLGYPFAAVRPHLNRDGAAHRIGLVYTVDDGPHVYIERINIRGNTFTREAVIRREFDIAEGDALNHALVARAERRLKALGLFKSVKVATAPGSTPDRAALNVDVEEQQTGAFSISGGYSTVAGIVGEVTVSERNFLGLGQYVKVSTTLGQYMRGASVSWVEPYFLDNRMTLGVDLFYRGVMTSPYQDYGSTNYGTRIRIAAPLTDTLSSDVHYSIYNQSVSLAPALMNCSPLLPPPVCFLDGEASAAIKQAVLNGPLWISVIGSTLAYNTVDNPKDPHDGIRAEVREDLAGLGGGADFIRGTGDIRYYHDWGNDIVGMARVQGGYITPFAGQTLPLTSGFFGGPTIVRGFAVNGFGPRDLTFGTTQDNIGGTAYLASTAEFDAPIPGLPPEVALKAAVFADAGSLWGYKGPTSFPALSPSLMTVGDSRQIRSSIGAGLIWDSPFGPMRVDYAIPLTKAPYDITQRLYFGVGGF